MGRLFELVVEANREDKALPAPKMLDVEVLKVSRDQKSAMLRKLQDAAGQRVVTPTNSGDVEVADFDGNGTVDDTDDNGYYFLNEI